MKLVRVNVTLVISNLLSIRKVCRIMNQYFFKFSAYVRPQDLALWGMCPPTVQIAFPSFAGEILLIVLLCCPFGVDSLLSSLFSAISLSHSAHHLAAITSWLFSVVTKGLTGINTNSILETGASLSKTLHLSSFWTCSA